MDWYSECKRTSPQEVKLSKHLDYVTSYILQQLVYEGRQEPFVDLRALKNTIGCKCNKANNETVSGETCLIALTKQKRRLIQHIFHNAFGLLDYNVTLSFYVSGM